MHFNSLKKILDRLEKQPGWEKFRDYRQLLKAWHNIVNHDTVSNTRPLYISRQVLWVATNSASRAQELSFQRYTLLKRLNQQLPFILRDIRFSSSGFYQTNDVLETKQILFTVRQQQSNKSAKNLSSLPFNEQRQQHNQGKNDARSKATIAAQHWLNTIDRDSLNSSLLPCSICKAPTPPAEIERWNSCYLCIAKKWSKEYRPPTFPKSP